MNTINQIRALIVDDETAARKTLSGMLGEFCPQVNVVGQCDNIHDAINRIEYLRPDLLFLDIQMSPYESGFDLLGRTKHLTYGVIFVTAYSQFAIRAINMAQPWAYLVKPFSADDLMEAVRTASIKMMEKQSRLTSAKEPEVLMISDFRKGKIVIQTGEILYCKAGHSLVEVHYLKNGSARECIYIYKSLRYLSTDLPASRFCRIHHGYLVNLAFVRQFEKNGRGGTAVLTDGSRLPVSVKKTGEFDRGLENYLRQRDNRES